MLEKYFRKFILLLAIWDFCLGSFIIIIGHPLLKKYGFGGELLAIPTFFVYWSGFFIILQSVVHYLLYLDLWNSKMFWLNFLYRAPMGIFHLIQYLFFLHSLDPLVTKTLIFFFCGDLFTGGLLFMFYVRNKEKFR
jgi:hypothetical protein